jgi:hypothetical protein
VSSFLSNILDPDLLGFLYLAWWVFCVVVNVFLSIRVYEDARRRPHDALRVSSGLWLAIALALPGVGAAVYLLANPPSRGTA